MLISIGDRVGPGVYGLHSRFDRAANYTCRGRMVSLVTREIGSGPSRIVVRGRTVKAPATLSVSRRSIALGPQRFSRAGVPKYPSRLRASVPRDPAALEQALVRHAPANSLAFLLDKRRWPRAPGFQRAWALHMRRAVDEFLAALRENAPARLRNAVKQIAGCGFGLTPSGDDFIAGALIALRLLKRTTHLARHIAVAARTGNALSKHCIELAAEGRAPEEVNQLAEALATGAPKDVRAAARRMFKHGETSGADLCTGLALTLKTAGSPLASDASSAASGLLTRSNA